LRAVSGADEASVTRNTFDTSLEAIEEEFHVRGGERV